MAKGTCIIVEDGETCGRPAAGRKMCGKHYHRWERHGDPLAVHKRSFRIDADGRECIRCGEYKPWEEFYRLRASGSRGHQSDCKPCHRVGRSEEHRKDPIASRERSRRWRAENPVKYQEGQIRKAARRLGLDPDMVLAHFREHGGACDICGGGHTLGNYRVKRLAIDHDHATGAFRGMLCPACNTGIGKLREDPRILMAAIAYLNRSTGQEEAA